MLPITLNQKRANDDLALYFRRLTKPNQIDWAYNLWTILQLLVSPKTVYKQISYHRYTKGGWARDDPGFVVLSAGGVAVLGILYGLIFSESLASALSIAVSAFFIYYLAFGFLLATITWSVANKFLHSRAQFNLHTNSSTSSKDHAVVDYPFCFDVHCNAMVPLVALLGVVQLVLSPILLLNSRLSAALSCLLYAAGFTQYCYVTFLGFAQRSLDRPETFLYPLAVLAVVLPLELVAGYNPTKHMLQFFFGYSQ